MAALSRTMVSLSERIIIMNYGISLSIKSINQFRDESLCVTSALCLCVDEVASV